MSQTQEIKDLITKWCEIFKNEDRVEVVSSIADGDFDSINFNDILGVSRPMYSEREDEDYQERIDTYYNAKNDFLKEIGYKHIEVDGGGEGGTEHVEGIFEMGGLIYRANWCYYSHQGYEYYDIDETVREVKLVEKVVYVYE